MSGRSQSVFGVALTSRIDHTGFLADFLSLFLLHRAREYCVVSPHGSSSRVQALLERAQAGSPSALGDILETFRAYLLVIAADELDNNLRAKVSPSDLVQDTFYEAHRDFAAFRGTTEAEFVVWLRCVLLNNVANATRRFFGTEKRQLNREVAMDDSSWGKVKNGLPTSGTSPSEAVMRNEQLERVERALGMLSATYREVITWRNLERQPFAQIAQRMGRSEKAVQKLWTRAIQELQRLLGQTS